jgi:hypothetical protein
MQTNFGLHKQMSLIKHPFELWQICVMHLEYHLPQVDYKFDYIWRGRVSISISNGKEVSKVGLHVKERILEFSCMGQNFAWDQTL